jgi:hypothetical protein
MRVPTSDKSAGNSVIAAMTATATAVAVPHARPVRKLRRTRRSPRSEIMTVTPANTTDRPAVRMASSIASITLAPRASAERWRVTMSNA